MNTNGVVRTYKVYGSETLDGGGDWQYPTNSLHRFFKVTVEMLGRMAVSHTRECRDML